MNLKNGKLKKYREISYVKDGTNLRKSKTDGNAVYRFELNSSFWILFQKIHKISSKPEANGLSIKYKRLYSQNNKKPPKIRGFCLYARRFELPTFWSVARRSIQLSYAYNSIAMQKAIKKVYFL